tara:strand:- start:203 stop:442 length:240 start_codon:yes stop_codon:yes gene_type:complete
MPIINRQRIRPGAKPYTNPMNSAGQVTLFGPQNNPANFTQEIFQPTMLTTHACSGSQIPTGSWAASGSGVYMYAGSTYI